MGKLIEYYLKVFSYLLNRYQSETKQNVLVGSQSSTYIEFKLKRKNFSNDDNENEKKGSFSTFINTTSSNVRTFYRQIKEFILHQTVFLIISGICGLYLLENLKIISFSFV